MKMLANSFYTRNKKREMYVPKRDPNILDKTTLSPWLADVSSGIQRAGCF